MKTNEIKVGSLLTYIQMGLGVIIGLLYTPFMTRLLGQSEYGLYNTVASTISMLSVLNFGFNSGYIRYYSKYKKKKDIKSIYRLNGMFMVIFSVIGVIALICGLFLSFNLRIIFSHGLTKSEYSTARILMLLLTVNLAVSFPMSVFSNIISANEHFVFLKLLGMFKTVGSPLLTLPLLLMGFRSVAMVCVTVVISFVTDILYFYYVINVLHNKFIYNKFDKKLLKSIFVYTFFIAINIIVDQINWNIDKMLLGRYKGTTMVAIYSVGFSLYQYYQMFSTAISSVFTPRIHRIVNETVNDMHEQKKQLTRLMTKVGRIQYIILSLICTGLIFFGEDFIVRIWVGKEYQMAYYVMLLLVISASIALVQNLGIEIQRAQNRHQFRSIAYLIMALVNFILSVFLCQKYGAVGSAIGTAISLVLANGIIMNIYYQKKCNVDIKYFWKNIISLTKGLVLPVICGIVLKNVMGSYSLGKYIISIIIYVIVFCISMWLLGMNTFEKKLVLSPLSHVSTRSQTKK